MADGRMRLWWDVDCGRCGKCSAMYGPNAGPGGISRELREDGWRLTRLDGWVCPKCAQEDMAKYRKKPVVIEARLLTKDTQREVAEWCGGEACMDIGSVRIHTLEGDIYARPGDYIIQGVAGEFYPCKPDIFAATYEAVE